MVCKLDTDLDDRLRTFWRKPIVQSFIPGIWLELAKLVPLRYRVLECWVNIVVAPVHLPNVQGQSDAQVNQHIVGPGTHCQSQALGHDCATCTCLHSYLTMYITKAQTSHAPAIPFVQMVQKRHGRVQVVMVSVICRMSRCNMMRLA